MGYSEAYQQAFQPWQNPQGWGQGSPYGHAGQQGLGLGIGQAAFGQQGGGYGPFGQGAWGGQGPWGPSGWGQRQLSHHDIGEVVRQLLPLLPHVIAQAQQQPQAAFGYGGFGQGGFGQQGPFAQGQRLLSQQDVGEVVRHILPILPQVVSALQGQQGPYAAAVYGNYGWGGQGQGPGQGQGQWPVGQYGIGQNVGQNLGQHQNPWGFGQQSYGGQLGPWQAAFGRGGQGQGWGQGQGQGSGQGWGAPQFNQADIGEVVRQLTAVIPQVVANLQQNQQRGSA